MFIKRFLSKILAKTIVNQTKKWSENPIKTQQKVFQELIASGKNTAFGKEHHFDKIHNYKDFATHVPIRDYEEIKPCIELSLLGENDVLWKGRPLYFAKTSGTTSGAEYIPLTKESMPYHISATRNSILHYIHETGKTDFVNGK